MAGAALLGALILFAYWPALHGGFIWDDTVNVSENPLIKASDGLYRFWFTTEAPDYWPLTATTFWLEWRLWGTNTAGYHVTNLVLHWACALLLWALLRRLNLCGAWLAAALFAVHPVNVESVAWITQRKNLMAMVFFLPALLCFLRSDPHPVVSDDQPRRSGWPWWYVLSLVLFVLAMLGKGSVAVMPVILALLLWWRRGRVSLRDLVRVLPFLAVALGMVLVNIWFQTHGRGHIRDAGLLERVLGAGAVVWFYLWKAVWPARLAFVYEQWHIDPRRLVWWLPLGGALVVTLVLFVRRAGRARPLFLTWALFVTALVPVMGLTDVYFMRYALVADHYQHLALTVICGLAAAGWGLWRERARGTLRDGAAALAVIVLGLLAVNTRHYAADYKDAETLYRATLATSPRAWLTHYNLAIELSATGRREEALTHYQEAVHWKPDLPDARVNLALLLLEGGRGPEALEQVERAVKLTPDAARAQYAYGLALAQVGRPRDAIVHFEQALKTDPQDAAAHNALGTAYLALGREEAATAEFERALALAPEQQDARLNLALARSRAGRPQEAIALLQEALRRNADLPNTHYNLGLLLIGVGRQREAQAHFEQALRLRPDYAEAHNNLALLLAGAGQLDEAIAHLQRVVELSPGFLPGRLNLAVMCARAGRSAEAVAHGRVALEIARASGRAEDIRTVEAWLARR